MKKFVLLAMVLLFGLIVVPVANPVLAQDDDDDTETTTQSDDEEDRQKPNRLERAENIEERKQQRRAEAQATIDEARTQRVAQRCEAAQNRIQEAIVRAGEVETKRKERYDTVSTKLSDLQARLAAADIDTATLSEQIVQFDSLVADFFADFNLFTVALQDAAEIDCTTDTEAFILALEEARSLRASLKASANEIQQYVKGTIIATLEEIKASLTQDETTNEGEEA